MHGAFRTKQMPGQPIIAQHRGSGHWLLLSTWPITTLYSSSCLWHLHSTWPIIILHFESCHSTSLQHWGTKILCDFLLPVKNKNHTQNLFGGEKREEKDSRLWGQAQCYRQHGGPSHRGRHRQTHTLSRAQLFFFKQCYHYVSKLTLIHVLLFPQALRKELHGMFSVCHIL